MKIFSDLLKRGAFFLLCFSPLSVFAQELPGIADSLYSDILSEQRAIQVVFPENYDADSDETLEVIYLLDGEWNTGHYEYLRNFLVQEGFIPNFLIVALPNTYLENVNQRDRDFLGETTSQNSQSGEAEKFSAFLKNELIPYIENKYPVNGGCILYGHSYGGLYSVYAFLNHPEVFDGFIATDPSLWWGNRRMIQLASKRVGDPVYQNKALWIAGISNTAEGMGILAMDSVLQAVDSPGLHWQVKHYPNETHNSVRLKGIYDGLKFMYNGYNNHLAFHPMSGILLEGAATPLLIQSDFQEVRYTTDGSEPLPSSSELKEGVSVQAPAQVVAKPFSGRNKYAKKVTGIFEVGKAWPASAKPEGAIQGGVAYRLYEGEWELLPDFSQLAPVETGHLDENFNFNRFPLHNFGLVFDGYLEITEAGHYIFGIDSDDGARLFINGKKIIDNDGLHGSGNPKSYILPLEVGFYPLRLEYFQREGGRELDFMYLPPGIFQPQQIPLERQYRVSQ